MYNPCTNELHRLEANHRAPSSLPLSTPLQQQNHVRHDTVIPSVTSTGQLQVQWENAPPAVGNSTAQDTPWDPHHTNVMNYGTADYVELASHQDLASPRTHPNVEPAHWQLEGTPQHVQIMFHENPRNDYFNRAHNGVVPGPAQAAFSNSYAHLAPDVGHPADNLRRLASRYIHHPNSQVDMVRMEPGLAGRYKVVIVLEMADLL